MSADQSRPKLDSQSHLGADLSVVIVNYNTCDEVLACLESLARNHGGLSLDIIVVDNCSSDNSVEMIQTRFPSVVLIEAPRNGGFSYGNNLGIEESRGKHILLLNPDTKVPEGTLRAAYDLIETNSDIGLVGVAQETAPGVIESSAFKFLRPHHFLASAILPKVILQRKPILSHRYQSASAMEDFYADAVTGCFMAIRRAAIEAVGGLDDRIFMYAEEFEFAWRLKEAGWKTFYLGSHFIEHRHGASTNNLSVWRDVQVQTGQLLYLRFTQGVIAARLAALFMTLSHLLRLPVETLAGNNANAKERRRSRILRLAKALAAIKSPPVSSGQSID